MISEPVITQGQPEGPQAASVPSPSTGAAEVDFEMTEASPVRQSPIPVEEANDRQLVLVPHHDVEYLRMSRPVKRHRTSGS